MSSSGGVPATGATLSAAYTPKWNPVTFYTAGTTVRAPDGNIVKALSDFTSGATYVAENWQYGTVPGSAPVIKRTGDGRAGVWEYIHNDITGYLFHLLVGAGTSSGSWIAGIGVDSGLGNGFIFRNKAQGIALKIEMLDTITSATAYGLAVQQKSTVAPAVSMTQDSAGTAPLSESFSFVNDGTDVAVMQRWTAFGKPGGEIRSTSGKLVWSQNIEVVGEAVDVRDYNVVPVGDRYRTKTIPRGFVLHSLSATNSWYGFKMSTGGSYFNISTAPVSANPDTATYTDVIKIRHNQIAFFNSTPISKPALTYSRAVENAADTQIRTTLAALGLVTDSTIA